MAKIATPSVWKKIDKFTAQASDGTNAWLDLRGIIGLERPDGCYISLGASFDTLHKKSIIKVYIGKESFWEKNGYDVGEKISHGDQQTLLNKLRDAMKMLGYSLKYIAKK